MRPAADWLKLADEFYAASIDTSDGGVGIPVVWGTDAVHGHSNIIGATLFPHNIGLGAMRDLALIERIGAATATEIRVTGQEWTFAPTVTVPQDYRWGRAYEGYSSNPDLVASYVGAMVRGLQGPPDGGAHPPARQGDRLDQTLPRRRRHRRTASTKATRKSARKRCATSMARLTARRSRKAWRR